MIESFLAPARCLGSNIPLTIVVESIKLAIIPPCIFPIGLQSKSGSIRYETFIANF